MPLQPGDKLGHYQVLSLLAVGGMGEVYRARDTTLKRDVALKVLPAALLRDADRMARFQREAEVLASLDHTNIGPIYGIIDSEDSRGLVLALIEGPTLADRIEAGPIPLDEAVAISKQIIDALEYAHDRGVVHRDLKPANVKITPDRVVKVLDFGLAKVLEDEPPPSSVANSPTLTLGHTRTGVILGTAAYMSPEQAVGRPVDRRSDIFSFGAVLYEMLTGKRTFTGATTPDVLEAVVKSDPDWSALPAGTPGHLRKLLERTLAKDRKQRLQAIGEARIALDNPDRGEQGSATAPSWSRFGLAGWAVTGAFVLAFLIAAVGWWRATRPVDLPLTRLSVDLGPDAMTGLNLTAAISPDGRRLVFPARAPNGMQQLATRLLDQAQATLLPGTENGRDPFFSPDSQWVGFFADGKLQKISVQGGAPVILCDALFDYGASWGEDGTIIATLDRLTGLSQVPAAGGRPQPFTRLGKGEASHGWPQVLPGGQVILFTAAPTAIGMENANIVVKSLKRGVTKALIAGGFFARYLPANGTRGYLVYLHQGVLLGVGFDPDRLELQGTPVPLLGDVASSPTQGGGQFDVSWGPSGHGTLVHLAGKGAAQTWPVVWLDSSAKMQPLITAPSAYSTPRFSPDGRRLALLMVTSSGTDIYVYELERETMTQLTFGGHAANPIWTPDGKHIAFQSSASGFGIGWIRSDGSGEPQQILAVQNITTPFSFSPDGRRLAYFVYNPETGRDIWTLPLDLTDPDHPKPGKPELFLGTPSNEYAPMFSPDGRWIAYRSDESGADEVYVRPFPAGRGGKWKISTGGGLYGIWSNNGRELFYETADYHIMVVDYTVNGDSFVPGKPRLWSEKRIFFPGTSNLALAPDGKRFAVFPMPEATGPEKGSVHVTMLLNFFDELRRKVPAAK